MTDPEINEAVARKLNGGQLKITAMVNDPIEGAPTDMVACYGPIPNYCHSIAAAWEVVPKLEQFKLEYWDVSKLWRVTQVRWYQNYDVTIAEAATAARAICEAFLKLP